MQCAKPLLPPHGYSISVFRGSDLPSVLSSENQADSCGVSVVEACFP